MALKEHELKCKLGALIVKLKESESPLDGLDVFLARILLSKGLVEFIPASASVGSVPFISAAYYELSGLGIEFALQNNDADLANGNFRFPGEKPDDIVTDFISRFRQHQTIAVVILVAFAVGFLLTVANQVKQLFK